MTMQDILNQVNILIAGVTGSGKSVLLNQLVCTAMKTDCIMYFIDPKRTGFKKFYDLPQTADFAEELTEIKELLNNLIVIMDERQKNMSAWDEMSEEKPIYVFIDELASLTISGGAEYTKLLDTLTSRCRSANMHIITATQSPSRRTIAEFLDINFTCQIALHCADANMSKQIIGEAGAENLPKHGKAMIKIDGEKSKLIAVQINQPLSFSVLAYDRFRSKSSHF